MCIIADNDENNNNVNSINPYVNSSSLNDSANRYLYIPVQMFEVQNMMSYDKSFIKAYSKLSAIFEIEYQAALQFQREAFSNDEINLTKQKLNSITKHQQKLEEVWKESRWILDVINNARDRVKVTGVPLSYIYDYTMIKKAQICSSSTRLNFKTTSNHNLNGPIYEYEYSVIKIEQDHQQHHIPQAIITQQQQQQHQHQSATILECNTNSNNYTLDQSNISSGYHSDEITNPFFTNNNNARRKSNGNLVSYQQAQQQQQPQYQYEQPYYSTTSYINLKNNNNNQLKYQQKKTSNIKVNVNYHHQQQQQQQQLQQQSVTSSSSPSSSSSSITTSTYSNANNHQSNSNYHYSPPSPPNSIHSDSQTASTLKAAVVATNNLQTPHLNKNMENVLYKNAKIIPQIYFDSVSDDLINYNSSSSSNNHTKDEYFDYNKLTSNSSGSHSFSQSLIIATRTLPIRLAIDPNLHLQTMVQCTLKPDTTSLEIIQQVLKTISFISLSDKTLEDELKRFESNNCSSTTSNAYCLVIILGSRERVLRDDYCVAQLKEPWLNGKFYIRLINESLAALKLDKKWVNQDMISNSNQ